MAVFLWVYGLMSPLSGIVGDRMSRKWLIVGSLCVWSGVTYLMGYATTFNQLYWLRGIMGISEALYLPAALSLIADFHKDKTRSLAVGIHMTGLYVGQAIGGFGATFDLPNRKLKVFHNEGSQQITAKLEGLGFGAKLDETQLSSGDIPNEPDPVRQAKVLKLLLGINALLFFIEFISGIIAASTGLIADSLDMFADAAVYGIALYAVGKAAKYQVKAAHFAGWIQLLLAVIVIIDVIRRFMFGSEPESTLMIVIGLLALIANVTCLYLISGHREDGAHMKASWIFSANDVVVNMGVIFAGVLVAWTGSAYPDLIIGILVSLFVLNGARKILALK
jgi:MFS family permease